MKKFVIEEHYVEETEDYWLHDGGGKTWISRWSYDEHGSSGRDLAHSILGKLSERLGIPIDIA
jgi:hypothetical protein